MRDKFHRVARVEYSRLLGDRRIFVATNLVIAETYILIRRYAGHKPAMRFLQSLRGSPRLQKIWSDAGLESRAEDILEKYADQDFSYTDAVSFAVMQERDVEEAFTFDSHFVSLGFRMLPVQEE
jgi:hypothetical protein